MTVSSVMPKRLNLYYRYNQEDYNYRVARNIDISSAELDETGFIEFAMDTTINVQLMTKCKKKNGFIILQSSDTVVQNCLKVCLYKQLKIKILI